MVATEVYRNMYFSSFFVVKAKVSRHKYNAKEAAKIKKIRHY